MMDCLLIFCPFADSETGKKPCQDDDCLCHYGKRRLEWEMSLDIEGFYEDIAAIRKILLKLRRTMDTDGCYNPFNKVAPYLAEVASKTRARLEADLK